MNEQVSHDLQNRVFENGSATLDLLLAPIPDGAIKPPNCTWPQKPVCDDHITHGKELKPFAEKVNVCD